MQGSGLAGMMSDGAVRWTENREGGCVWRLVLFVGLRLSDFLSLVGLLECWKNLLAVGLLCSLSSYPSSYS